MTNHVVLNIDSSNMSQIASNSVDLIITSPPYPMIEMWDKVFSKQNSSIDEDLKNGNGNLAFKKMHKILNSVWDECDRVLSDNGFICINIGDATRTIGNHFQLFSNHSMVIDFFLTKGYSVLPDIHWRKQSNSPNKFMGSGMYPAGAYVTYEHEYILIFRKGGKRVFKGAEKELRQKSAYFWEERNIWFSDLWEIKGTSQEINSTNSTRTRNASFPFEIPYRLVNMYSVKGDTILDPFVGLGTTNIACMLSNRNSIGIDIDPEIATLALKKMNINIELANIYIHNRIQKHMNFISSLSKEKREKCYQNESHGFLVKTRQESAIEVDQISNIRKLPTGYECQYKKYSPHSFSEQLSISL